jgi:hypothetical protein
MVSLFAAVICFIEMTIDLFAQLNLLGKRMLPMIANFEGRAFFVVAVVDVLSLK